MRHSFPDLGKRARAERANARGLDLDRQGRTEEAIEQYERACRIDPTWSVPHYNLGLLHKYEGDWEASMVCNRRATELDPSDEAAWWNLALAATALGRWDVARSAWHGAGIDVPEGDGPVELPCGHTPIRLSSEEGAEVVWADRIDPARAIIRSIPLPDSGFRYGDVVLHDGAPNGYRKSGDAELPVFDCLDLLEESAHSTWLAEIDCDADAPAIGRLLELASERGLAAEDWSTSITLVCKECSEGRAHSHQAPEPLSGPRRVAIAAKSAERVHRLLEEWQPEAEGARVTLEMLLPAEAN